MEKKKRERERDGTVVIRVTRNFNVKILKPTREKTVISARHLRQCVRSLAETVSLFFQFGCSVVSGGRINVGK